MAVFNFTVRAEDNLNNFADRAFSIEVLNTLRERIVILPPSGASAGMTGLVGLDNDGAQFTEELITTLPTIDTQNGGTWYDPVNSQFWYVTRTELYSSPDGKVWTFRTPSTADRIDSTGANVGTINLINFQEIYGTLYGFSSGRIWIMGQASGGLFARVMYSDDGGATWNYLENGALSTAAAAAWNNITNLTPNQFIAENPNTGTIKAIAPDRNTFRTALGAYIWNWDGVAGFTRDQLIIGGTSGEYHKCEIVFEGGVFIAYAATTIPASSCQVSFDDGVSWTDITPNFAADEFVSSVRYLNGTWVFNVCRFRFSPAAADPVVGRLVSTTDFVTFTTVTHPTYAIADIVDPGSANDASKIMSSRIVRSQGRLYSLFPAPVDAANAPASPWAQSLQLYYSEDGTTWVPTATESIGFGNDVTGGGLNPFDKNATYNTTDDVDGTGFSMPTHCLVAADD